MAFISAETSDFDQAILVDLGTIKNVTGIATQGRAHSDEFVIEFRIQYGSNGKDWIDYKEVDGSPKLFLGNEDGDYVVRNDFDQPIIAQWIRINPTRWADRISMRLELYGCEYIPDVLHFDGKALIKRDLSRHPVSSLRDNVRLRYVILKRNFFKCVLFQKSNSSSIAVIVYNFPYVRFADSKPITKMGSFFILEDHKETTWLCSWLKIVFC